MPRGPLIISRRIGAILKSKGTTLVIAESCTGGYLSHLITSVPGSSAYYKGSVVSYDNKIKIRILGVKKSTLRRHGAVSAACASELARGVLNNLDADYALATTGIAGPTGAVKGKPVGTVYIACASKKNLVVERFNFKGNRAQVIEQAARKALQMLLDGLL